MKIGDKLVCKNNKSIYASPGDSTFEFPLVIDREYILIRYFHTSSISMTTYSIGDILSNKVCDITISGDQDLIWDMFYSTADYREITLNQLGIKE